MKIVFKSLSTAVNKSPDFDLNSECGRITVGRKPDNDFVIPLPNVSSYHAVLEFQDGRISIEDLNSTNGVFLNGRKLTEREYISCGDRVAFGSIDFLVECESESGALTGPSSSASETKQSAEGTVLVDITQIPGIPVNGERSIPGGDTAPVDGKAKQTVLFGKKNVLMPPRLILLDSQMNPTEEFDLEKSEILVGREPENDIQIDDVSISRIHARLVRTGDKFYSVEDENSTNGLFLRDKQIRQHTLHHGDLIRFGDVSAVYLAPGKLFSFEDLKAGKSGSGGVDGKKKLLIGVVAVMILLLLVLLLLPTEGNGPGPRKGNRLTQAEIMKEVHLSLDNQDWDKVVELIQSFQLQNADKELARAKMEIANRTKFLEMTQKLKVNDFIAAEKIRGEIDPASTYASRSEQVLRDAEAKYIDDQGEEIEDKLGQGDFNAAYQLAGDLKEKFPNNKEVLDQYSDVEKKYRKFQKRLSARSAYIKRQRRANRTADKALQQARKYYLDGRIVDALAMIDQASNAYLKENLKIPSRIRHLKLYMNQVRESYEKGKQLALQGRVSQAVPLFEKLFKVSKENLYGENGKVEQDSMALMVDYYIKKASELYHKENYAAAYEYLTRILASKPGMQKALSMKRDIENKGQELYNKGYIEQTQYQDCKRAVFYFKQVVQMVPKSNPLYKKALKRISDCEE